MEYTNAAITIGGKIKRADLDKLVDTILDDSANIVGLEEQGYFYAVFGGELDR